MHLKNIYYYGCCYVRKALRAGIRGFKVDVWQCKREVAV